MPSITNVQVYGLEQSIFRSGYPLRNDSPTEEEFDVETCGIKTAMLNGDLSNKHIKRAINLANAKGGGHDQFLTGIIVQFDLTVSQKCWPELQRYHFLDFVSSMSTMHRISKFKIRDCCNQFVSDDVINTVEKLQKKYNAIPAEHVEEKKSAYLDLLYNIPSGFELASAMTTNYRQLKTMYTQRRKQGEHRLPDWWYVNDWIETLPLSNHLITGGVQ
jgi:hypothetical protein